jgi:hypothetical protein
MPLDLLSFLYVWRNLRGGAANLPLDSVVEKLHVMVPLYQVSVLNIKNGPMSTRSIDTNDALLI